MSVNPTFRFTNFRQGSRIVASRIGGSVVHRFTHTVFLLSALVPYLAGPSQDRPSYLCSPLAATTTVEQGGKNLGNRAGEAELSMSKV